MSREILFRGMNGSKQMIEGYFFQSWEKCFILWGTTNGVPNMTKVDPATVGQFTGLYDDKGRKVFEGDIIDVRGRFKSEVRYISRNAGYLIKDNYGDWKWLYDVLASMPCEVIGNIHDNPELAKEEESK